MPGRAAQHVLCIGTDRFEHLAAAARLFPDRYDRRLIENDSSTRNVDQSVRGAKIDGQIY